MPRVVGTTMDVGRPGPGPGEEPKPMCGIVGYTGNHEASPILVAGLRRLEYRGYDSAGVATLDLERLVLRKRAGRVRALEEALQVEPAGGTCGISHTRW